MAENKGRPGGKSGAPKIDSRRAASKARQTEPESATGKGKEKDPAATVRPAGQGGRKQQAGGPDHHGLDAGEDRNP